MAGTFARLPKVDVHNDGVSSADVNPDLQQVVSTSIPAARLTDRNWSGGSLPRLLLTSSTGS